MNTPYWYQVLSHFESNNYYNNGLTIPFLIGSRTIVEPNEDIETVGELLEDFSSSSHPITIMYCGYLREYVIGLLDSETDEIRKQNKKMYKEFDNLLVIDNSFNDISNLSELITLLENQYQTEIENGDYSKEAGSWGAFSEIDEQRLQEISS